MMGLCIMGLTMFSCLKPPPDLTPELEGYWRCSNAGFVLYFKEHSAKIYRAFSPYYPNPWHDLMVEKKLNEGDVFIQDIEQTNTYNYTIQCLWYRYAPDGTSTFEWHPGTISMTEDMIYIWLVSHDGLGNEQSLRFHRVLDAKGYMINVNE
ncbi:MAG: hypothetical protein LBR51_01960 [Bacteroidales bacterium]|nr:hypothetical protein [Bacteroidales bacterium]